ncbi:MAG TPA: type II secretion system F family protein [Oculatellaceae cyanobacterium]|jgi:type IV pilus assembly protein PilC
MPTYVAEVRDSQGKAKKEKVVAGTIHLARDVLRQKYPSVQNIKESQSFDLASFDMSSLEVALSKVTVKDKAVFSRQFAAMVNAGVALVRCLNVLSEQCSNARLKKALVAINAEVQQGTSLSEAMRKHPDCFDNLYISMVQAGEVGGVLDEVLNRLAKILEDIARLQNQVKGAMAYPTVVGILAIIVFIAMTVFLIPIFAGIFKNLGGELPALTQFMMLCSDVLRSWRILIPICTIIATSFAYNQYYKTPVGRLTMDRFFLNVPILGDLNQKSAVARFCRIFGTLTRSGVPILNSLEIVASTAGNQVIENAINAAKAEIQQGGMLSLAIEKENVFPPLAVQMISIGEETGELDAMMMKVADFYEDEVEQAVKALTSVLEPLMMVGLAGMVAVILLSMYLPMFAVFEKLG